jgi:hypothetical protein
MSLAGGERKYLRRWTISAAVVVLAHVAIAGAVLTWRKVIAPPPGPVVVELTPEPVAPARTEPPQTQQDVASKPAPEKPSGQVEEQRDDRTASKGSDKTEPKAAEPSPSVSAPVTIAPPASATTEPGLDTNPGTGGGPPPAGRADRGNPIDLVNPGIASNQGAKLNDRQKALKSLLARLSKHQGGPRSPSVVFRSVARNAIGALEEDRAAIAGTSSSAAAPGAANSPNRTATNAIGATVPVPPNAGGLNHSARSKGLLTSNNASPPNSGISGTGLNRPGSGSGTIGGAAKATTGGINGTNVRSR